jgi:hypothetical protein
MLKLILLEFFMYVLDVCTRREAFCCGAIGSSVLGIFCSKRLFPVLHRACLSADRDSHGYRGWAFGLKFVLSPRQSIRAIRFIRDYKTILPKTPINTQATSSHVSPAVIFNIF